MELGKLLPIAVILLSQLLLSPKFLVFAGKQGGWQSLRPGDSLAVESDGDFLVSPDGTFSAGFYKVGNTAYYYAIWFSNSADKTVAWMANRDRPVHGQASKLYFREDGDLLLMDGDGTTVWETQSYSQGAAKVQLLETGNLVVFNSTDGIIWESFANPTDTLLPYQQLNISTMLVSMRGPKTYLSGYYKFRFTETNVLSLMFDSPDTSSVYWPDTAISSPFDFGRTPYNSSRSAFLDSLGYFSSSDNLNFKASDYGLGPRRRLTLGYDGFLRLYSLDDSSGLWNISWLPYNFDACNVHGLCGPNGVCAYEPKPTCTCPPGFNMTDPSDWFKGCSPQFTPACNDSDFIQLFHTDFYGNDLPSYGKGISFEACRNACLADCQCKGFQFRYTGEGACYPKSILLNGYQKPDSPNVMNIKVRYGTNLGNSMKLNIFSMNCSGNELLLPFPVQEQKHKNSYLRYLIAFVASIGVVEIICISFGWWYMSRINSMEKRIDMGYLALAGGFKKFSYKELKNATRNFQIVMGKGGFGTVYRGTLDDNREVAVKRLEGILQGEAEFWAEVSIIGKINHMNLVRMWGFCAEGRHRLLVYEYMENGSLDGVLFSSYNDQLDWERRFDIALGTAKGLSYLHEDCLEWILHCDIKPQNILLDRDLRAKVSDFGMAKLFDKRKGPDAGFSRVRGTRGYLAPEWIMNHEITSKADTFSYGIVLLELITGRSASGNESNSLVQWVEQKLGENGQGMEEAVDQRLNGVYDAKQLEKLLKVALLCVTYDKEKRPTMGEVVGLLLQDERLK